jgi:Na+/H+ antiporter
MPWPAAFVLGAIVAPPDAVAVTAVTRRLGIPRRVEAILEGEGLINDATALVAYRMSVRSVDASTFSWLQAGVQFVVAAAGGVAVGLAVGVAVVWIRRRLTSASEVENTISLLTPFAAFIPAERLGVSGVLAVVAVGLYVARQVPRILSPENRVEGYAMWGIVTFVLEGLIFILIGLDLPIVARAMGGESLGRVVSYGLVVGATIVVVRIAWTFPAAYLPPLFASWRGRPAEYPPWRRILFIGWAGIRGADSLVIALSLPLTTPRGAPFPGRGLIIVVTFIVILVTLVMQGLTLAPVLTLLKLDGRDTAEDKEESEAQLRMARAGVARLERLIDAEPALAPVARALRDRHRHRVHRYAERTARRRHVRDERAAADYRTVRGEMLDAEREELLRLRDESVIGDAVMRRLQRDLDLEQLLLDRQEPSNEE